MELHSLELSTMQIQDVRAASTLVRALIAKAATKSGGTVDSIEFARARWGGNDPVVTILERGVSIGTGDIGPDLRAAQRGFIELVNTRSLIGKIVGWRRVPARVPLLRQVVSPVASWVPEGGRRPVSMTDLEHVQLDPQKIGLILIQTDELIRAAGGDFEASLSRDLVRSVARLESASLFDPLNAGIPDTSPASLTYGITPIASSGDARTDVEALVASFDGDLEAAWLVTTPVVALGLHRAGFDAAGVRGGEVAGLPLATSSALPGSSAGNILVLIDPTRVMLVDDGIALDASDQSTLTVGEGEDAVTISLWQQNLSALAATRRLNWQALPGAISYVTGADYGSGT